MHAWTDKYSVVMASAIMKHRKWFRYSLESPTFREYVDTIELSLPEISGEGIYETPGSYSGGTLDPAFHIVKWLGPEYPSLIYHHGNNEQPFSYRTGSKNTFKTIVLAKKELFEANIINIRAPFHNSGMKLYLERIGHLGDFTAMLSTSVKLIELLVEHLQEVGSSSITVSGISLGGWVTTLHRSLYNTADVYVPLLAGAALDALFTTSYYRRLSSDLVKHDPKAVEKVLNFEREFMACRSDNVFPLLARFDQIIEYERQKMCYGQREINVLDKGHITAALAAGDLRSHLLAHM